MKDERMLMVVWRIYSDNFNPQQFAETFDLEPSKIYNKGDKDLRGRVNERGGMNIPICEEEKETLNEGLQWFFDEYFDAISALKKEGVESELDIGVIVGDRDHEVMHSFSITPEIMGLLSKYDITLGVSAYLASD